VKPKKEGEKGKRSKRQVPTAKQQRRRGKVVGNDVNTKKKKAKERVANQNGSKRGYPGERGRRGQNQGKKKFKKEGVAKKKGRGRATEGEYGESSKREKGEGRSWHWEIKKQKQKQD